jgi:hypothetical protein
MDHKLKASLGYTGKPSPKKLKKEKKNQTLMVNEV